MNLYVITPDWSPSARIALAESDEEALDDAISDASHNAVTAEGSPSATVYCVAENLRRVGQAWATDAPREWKWAHPGVEENAAMIACLEVELDGDGAR